MNEWKFNDTPAQNINQLLGVRQMAMSLLDSKSL